MTRHFLSLRDLSLAEARSVLSVAKTMKHEPKGARLTALAGKSVAIVMEKASTRTRVSFEVGVAQLGAHPVVLTTQGSQLARGEPIGDTARVLSRYCDAIVFRTFETARLEGMAKFASVPVVNALSDDGHPVQVLCDVFTIEEALKSAIDNMRVAWIGDGSSNMARSFVQAAELFGFHLSVGSPAGYFPPEKECAHAIATGCASFTSDPNEAVLGADAVNTDVWTSMGQEADNAKRVKDFQGWTLTEDMMSLAKPGAIVLHCLPAHRGEEITDALIEGPRSRVWDQAENRLHVQKALLTFLMGSSG